LSQQRRGWAGQAGAILDEVVDALEALQSLVQSCGDLIKSVDVNPLLVGDAAALRSTH